LGPGAARRSGRPVLLAPVLTPVRRHGNAAADEHQDGEHDHSEREPRDGRLRAQRDNVLIRVLPQRLRGKAHDDEQQPGHERQGASDREGDDYPHTSRGGCSGAH